MTEMVGLSEHLPTRKNYKPDVIIKTLHLGAENFETPEPFEASGVFVVFVKPNTLSRRAFRISLGS
jgi:hypothetical protein